jgi:hypothetical protein
MPEDEQPFKRMPSADRSIKDIKPDDIRIRVLGTVIGKEENTVVIDDGTGKINVRFEEPVNAEINNLVRVFGRVIPLEKGFELQGEIIQDMKGLDISLYKKLDT